jgi:hypothetical protein
MISGDERANYTKAIYTESSIVLWSSKVFEATVPSMTPVAYDILEFLEIKESDPTFVGTAFVGIIPLIILGAGIYFYWIRRKRSASAE